MDKISRKSKVNAEAVIDQRGWGIALAIACLSGALAFVAFDIWLGAIILVLAAAAAAWWSFTLRPQGRDSDQDTLRG